MKILIIEDEEALRDTVRESLLKEKFIVECAEDYATAMSKINDYDYDCILLDIMLPGGSGLSILAHLKKQRKKESVIILSAKDSIEDKVEGLNLGADDYLAKPFHLAELIARVRSVIRRNQHEGNLDIILGNTTIKPDTYQVYVNGTPLDLNKKEYDILLFFANRKGRLIDKITLAENVWGDHIDQVDNYDFIYAQIKNLRKKLKDSDSDIQIKSAYGFGYKMVTE